MSAVFNTSMGRSEALDKFMPAFLEFQKEAENVERNRENPFLNSRYATLASILDHVLPLLNKNKLALIQSPSVSEDGTLAYVTTVVIHESGQFICGTAGAKPGKMDGQGTGSIISYLRRYGAAALLGITQADDDAERATDHKETRTDSSKLKAGAPRPALRGKQEAGEEDAAALGAKSVARWPQIRARLIEDGMTDVKAESQVQKYREEWAKEADKEAGGDTAKKIKGILKRQEEWAKEANLTFQES